jgi:hypothetical protein
MSDKLNIGNEMRQMDQKNRSFFDQLTPEEKKKFSTYLMIRWSSCVDGSRELQEYYVQSTNHYLNRHFFTVSKHPKLQWLMATAASPALGTPRHNWISPKKAKANAKQKQLASLFPHLHEDELAVLVEITDNKDIEQYKKDLGNPDQ